MKGVRETTVATPARAQRRCGRALKAVDEIRRRYAKRSEVDGSGGGSRAV